MGPPNKGLTHQFVRKLMTNKMVIIIGDSIQRGIYKDLVSLLQRDYNLSEKDLRAKGEMTFLGDELVEGGVKASLNNGVNYTEVRQYATPTHLVRFYFVTRCYNQYVESILKDLSNGPQPDLVIMNSCLWDMTRYGTTAITEYKNNMQMLFCRLTKILPPHCLMIWNTTLPISKNARGGFLVQEIEYKNHMLRMDVLESNFFARQIVVNHGFDVLDLHFWFRRRLDWRAADGIHWCAGAHRRISELLLTHVSNAWGMPIQSFNFSDFDCPVQRPFTNLPSLMPLNIVQAARRMLPERPPALGPVRTRPTYRRPTPYSSLPSAQGRMYQAPQQNARYFEDVDSFGRLYAQPSPSPSLQQLFEGCRPSGEGSRPFPNVQQQLQLQSRFGGGVLPLAQIPVDFSSQWTPYADDSFRGPQRRPPHAATGHSRYHQY